MRWHPVVDDSVVYSINIVDNVPWGAGALDVNIKHFCAPWNRFRLLSGAIPVAVDSLGIVLTSVLCPGSVLL